MIWTWTVVSVVMFGAFCVWFGYALGRHRTNESLDRYLEDVELRQFDDPMIQTGWRQAILTVRHHLWTKP